MHPKCVLPGMAFGWNTKSWVLVAHLMGYTQDLEYVHLNVVSSFFLRGLSFRETLHIRVL